MLQNNTSYDQIKQAVWALEGGAIDFPSSSYIFILSVVVAQPKSNLLNDEKAILAGSGDADPRIIGGENGNEVFQPNNLELEEGRPQ